MVTITTQINHRLINIRINGRKVQRDRCTNPRLSRNVDDTRNNRLFSYATMDRGSCNEATENNIIISFLLFL
jgi:hypothetical protein